MGNRSSVEDQIELGTSAPAGSSSPPARHVAAENTLPLSTDGPLTLVYPEQPPAICASDTTRPILQLVPQDATGQAEQTSTRRLLDVQPTSLQTAMQVQPARADQQSRPQKRQTGLDPSGRYRHTFRLDPKIEQELHEVAELLGVDLNAAMSVCISEHYCRLKKAGHGHT